MKDKETKISICMITWNAEKYLDESLNSVSGIADEIIIVDRFSTDNTLTIAKKYNARVFQKDLGFYESRKFAEGMAGGNWIFILDSDEVLSDGLKSEILDVVNNNVDCIRFPFLYLMKGRFVKYPFQNTMRLFKRGKAILLNKPVHEIYVPLSKNTVTLKNPVYCFGWSVNAQLDKFKRYTDLEILRLEKEGYVFKWYHLLSKPLEAFFFYFILKMGWRSGLSGLLRSIFKSFYSFITVAKFWEFNEK